MALQGTLKDFALPDILQLIGIQRKTGVLTMESERDTVTVQFFQGQVVGADTKSRRLEDLLGSVLVRTGKITEAQLQEVLAIQRETLQRLGYVLVKSGFLSEDELRDALRVQINQIVYRLFRWRDGRYNFAPMEHLEYDRNLTIPVPAETVLMEAARMIDEWPLIERRIKSPKMRLRKTPAGREFEARAPVAEDDSEFNLDLFGGAGQGQGKEDRSKESAIVPSPEERELLRLLDGKSTVQDVVDRSSLGEFDVHRILADFVARALVEDSPAEARPDAGRERGALARLGDRAAVAAIGLAAALAVATLGLQIAAPWQLGAPQRETERLRGYVSLGRLERLESAIQTHYLATGSPPQRLEALVAGGYLDAKDRLDPWGRPFLYRLDRDGYTLGARNAAGEVTEELTLSHRFTPSQRAILEGAAGGAPGEPSLRP